MTNRTLESTIQRHLEKLCVELNHRHVGSAENQRATDYFARTVSSFGFDVVQQPFACIDWSCGKVTLEVERQIATVAEWEYGSVPVEVEPHSFTAHVSPYSLPCNVTAPLSVVSTLQELETAKLHGRIALIIGNLAAEQIMPKSFTFYNPEHHRKTVALLEEKQPLAIITATGHNPGLAGGWYPFPMFEDGDFDIPSVYMKDVDGEKLQVYQDQYIHLKFDSKRIPATANNIVARKGDCSDKKILVTAHIDSKQSTPGALDNATGVSILLALAELLQNYSEFPGIEIVPFNGEDYYSIPGQMTYLDSCNNTFDTISLMINIDGAGYREGRTALSTYNADSALETMAEKSITGNSEFMIGKPWVQGDHSIFTMQGVPAIAVTSEKFEWLCQEITHTAKDNLTQVSVSKLEQTARLLRTIIQTISRQET